MTPVAVIGAHPPRCNRAPRREGAACRFRRPPPPPALLGPPRPQDSPGRCRPAPSSAPSPARHTPHTSRPPPRLCGSPRPPTCTRSLAGLSCLRRPPNHGGLPHPLQWLGSTHPPLHGSVGHRRGTSHPMDSLRPSTGTPQRSSPGLRPRSSPLPIGSRNLPPVGRHGLRAFDRPIATDPWRPNPLAACIAGVRRRLAPLGALPEPAHASQHRAILPAAATLSGSLRDPLRLPPKSIRAQRDIPPFPLASAFLYLAPTTQRIL